MLSARKWSKPIEASLRGSLIRFQLRILPFIEARGFQLSYSRIRFDVVAGEMEKLREEERANSRALLAKFEALAAAAGVPLPGDPPAGADPLDWRVEAVAAALDAAGVQLPPKSAAEIDEEIATLSRQLEERTKALALFHSTLPDDFVRSAFAKFVRNVEGLRDDETGEPITSGDGLLEHADEQLVTYVLSRLYRLSKVGEQEKNGSSSLSISGPAAVTTDGTSVAGPVLSEGGANPGTAPAISPVGT